MNGRSDRDGDYDRFRQNVIEQFEREQSLSYVLDRAHRRENIDRREKEGTSVERDRELVRQLLGH